MTSVQYAAQPLVAGIDWITCTARSPARMAALMYLGTDLLMQEEATGGVVKPWFFKGYAGSACGQIQAGYKPTGVVVRASGAAARECAGELIECAENVSRLDLQLTVMSSQCRDGHAKDLYEALSTAPRGRGRGCERTLITSTYTGDTLYLGRRISDQYGRIYNKSALERTREDPPRWRYEVEFKKGYARAAAEAYAASNKTPEWCAGRVARWFADRGAGPPVSTVPGDSIRSAPRGSAQEAGQLEWLKRAVRPVVKKLAAKYGWPDTLAVLGVPMAYSERYVNETLAGLEDL